ncbi:MAG: HtaA domain-containing protein [Microbacteriaceae bacterium]|nr:HtaA domain-containing protein [Microbacteriaceae bacterium]
MKRTIFSKALATLSAGALLAGGLFAGSIAAQAAEGDRTVSDSTLNWGLKDSFHKYIKGGARGSWTTSGNISETPSPFAWSKGEGSANCVNNTLSVGYQGSVHYTGHHGILDLKISNPRVEITGNTGKVTAEITSRPDTDSKTPVKDFGRINLANLNNVTFDCANGSFSAPKVNLTANGSEVFAKFYEPGIELNSLNGTVKLTDPQVEAAKKAAEEEARRKAEQAAAEAEAAKAEAKRKAEAAEAERLKAEAVAAAKRKEAEEAAKKAATEKTEADKKAAEEEAKLKSEEAAKAEAEAKKKAEEAAKQAAAEATAKAEAEKAQKKAAEVAEKTETPKKEAVNTAPTAPNNAGTKTETGTKKPDTNVNPAPSNAPVAPAQPVCVANKVTGGAFNWGVKESFRNYINGPIAKGAIENNGFGQGAGGQFNTDSKVGSLSFGGGIKYSGHKGVLDTRFSNPRVQLTSANGGTLFVDVYSNDADGKLAVNQASVPFATFVGTPVVSGNTVSLNATSVNLTAAGAKAFAGFYEAGQALDNFSLSANLGDKVACDENADLKKVQQNYGLAHTGAETPVVAIAVVAVLLVAGAAAFAIPAIRRRRTAAESHTPEA